MGIGASEVERSVWVGEGEQPGLHFLPVRQAERAGSRVPHPAPPFPDAAVDSLDPGQIGMSLL